MIPRAPAGTFTLWGASSSASALVGRFRAALDQDRHRRRHVAERLQGDARRDVDVSRPPRSHVSCGLLAGVDEALEVGADERAKVLRRVVDEGFREEDAGVVHEHVHLIEALDSQREQPLRGLGLRRCRPRASPGCPARRAPAERASRRSPLRALPTTLKPSSRYAFARAKPMPLEAPVIPTVFSFIVTAPSSAR